MRTTKHLQILRVSRTPSAHRFLMINLQKVSLLAVRVLTAVMSFFEKVVAQASGDLSWVFALGFFKIGFFKASELFIDEFNE